MNKKDKRENLIHYKSNWNNGKTTTMRLPIVLKEDVNNYALCIDKGNIKYYELLELYKYFKEVKSKLGIDNGYKSNNSGKLIKELKQILKSINI